MPNQVMRQFQQSMFRHIEIALVITRLQGIHTIGFIQHNSNVIVCTRINDSFNTAFITN